MAEGTPTTDSDLARRRILYGPAAEGPNYTDPAVIREKIVTGHGQRPEYRDTAEIRRRIMEGDHPEVTP